MKKITKILAAAAVLACGLILSGCAAAETIKETVVENVNGSYKQWYKYTSKKQIDVPLIDASIDEDKQPDDTPVSEDKLKNAEIYLYFDPDVGLTVAVQTVTQQEVSLLGGIYTQNVDMVVGDFKEIPKEKFGKKSWYTVWGSGKLEKSSEPKIHKSPDECIRIGTDKAPKSKIQWKKVLANYLLDSLLDE